MLYCQLFACTMYPQPGALPSDLYQSKVYKLGGVLLSSLDMVLGMLVGAYHANNLMGNELRFGKTA